MLRFLSIILGLISVGVYSASSKGRVPLWQIKAVQDQGPNVCIVEEIPETGWKYWTECKFWPVRKICGKDAILRYECCDGYRQIPGEDGCTGVRALKNVVETARELGAVRFVRFLEDSGIAEELTKDGTFTLFAPDDAAFEGHSGSMVAMKIESFLRSAANQNPLLRYHISDRKCPSKEFSANLELESQYNRNILRINKYSNGMDTVNGVIIKRKDQEATNGVVHIIREPLDPTLFMPRNVVQVLIEDGRFTRFVYVMTMCGFMQRFSNSDEDFSILAPTDESFLKISPPRLEKIISDKESCKTFLENHVIPHVISFSAITEETKLRTLGHGHVTFSCDEKGPSVNGDTVQGEYIMAENGVVHVMEDVLIPNRARTLLELVEKHQLYTFYQLIRVAGLEDTFDSLGDYTLFAPSEAAIYSMGPDILDEAKRNPELARKIVLFHVTNGRILSHSMSQNQMVTSLDEENTLRLSVYRRGNGVENALIEKGDFEGINGCLHIINKVLFPARQSAGDLLRKSGNFTLFLEAMEHVLTSSAASELDFWMGGEDAYHYTFFVPTDRAFNNLEAKQLRRIERDYSYMAKVLKNHVLKSIMASTSFRDNLIYEVMTEEEAVGIMCQNDKMQVNEAKVIQKDIMSSNGIIHVIDKLILPEDMSDY